MFLVKLLKKSLNTQELGKFNLLIFRSENKTQDTTKKNKSGISANINKSKEDNKNAEENVGFEPAERNIVQSDKNHYNHPNFRIESNKSNDSIFVLCKLIINNEEGKKIDIDVPANQQNGQPYDLEIKEEDEKLKRDEFFKEEVKSNLKISRSNKVDSFDEEIDDDNDEEDDENESIRFNRM